MFVHTINNFSRADDAPVLKLKPANLHLHFKLNPINFFGTGNILTGVDSHGAAILGRPIAVFNVFDARANQPCPRLSNRDYFHRHRIRTRGLQRGQQLSFTNG
jgi:hypothetical protein